MNDDRFARPEIAALATAVDRGDVAAMRREMQAVHPDTPGSDGTTLLIKAIADDNLTAVQALLDGGADPNRAGKGGETPVHAAAFADNPCLLETVLAHGGDPDAVNPDSGETALMRAIVGLHPAQVRLLLEAGADPGRADRNGTTALHTAASVNAGGVILMLLHAGAPAEARDAHGDTFQPVYFGIDPDLLNARARQERHDVIEWLKAHGIPLEAAAES